MIAYSPVGYGLHLRPAVLLTTRYLGRTKAGSASKKENVAKALTYSLITE